jgi:hypothetical protein
VASDDAGTRRPGDDPEPEPGDCLRHPAIVAPDYP